MVSYCLKHDFTAASYQWKNWLELNPMLYEQGNPVGIKAVLEDMGLCGSAVRLPLTPASGDLKNRIRMCMEGMMAD
jgi:4-hydroxy-tetrahydrodipicolinate synthase